MGKGIVYISIIVSVNLLSYLAGFSTTQVLSLAIFFMIIFGTIMYWRFHLPFALLGISLLLAFGLLDIPHLVEFAGLDIILFLVGMMIFVGYLEENHFFESLVNALIRYAGPRPVLLLVALMVAGAVSAALVDEVTSILFMAATMIHLTSRFGVNPIPFVIIQVFATNIGSSATVVVKIYLEPKVEPIFHSDSYGYQRIKDAHRSNQIHRNGANRESIQTASGCNCTSQDG